MISFISVLMAVPNSKLVLKMESFSFLKCSSYRQPSGCPLENRIRDLELSSGHILLLLPLQKTIFAYSETS